MSEESGERKGRSGELVMFNNEFYNAIMDEDVGRLEDMSKKYGSNSNIDKHGDAPETGIWQVQSTIPLHLAASYKRVKSMQSLLSTGADPEMRDQLSRTTLHLLIAGWPRIRTTWPKPGSKFQTGMIGMRRQAEACLRLLCEHGVNVKAEMEGSQQTALHLSVRNLALSAVQILTSYGADVNAVDNTGMTPLHMAAGILHKDIMACLIKEGADLNMGVRHSGNTPLHLASVAIARAMTTSVAVEEDMSCILLLLEQGVEVNAVNYAGMTPLQEACSMGNEELVDLLLRYGADINKLNKAGENCLFLFLNHWHNVQNGSLLLKLLGLTSPLTVHNQKGHLPFTLRMQCFFEQRDQLLKLTQQPRRLQDMCKRVIYLQYVQGKREELRKILPEKIYDFVFNCWENLHNISFVANDDEDSSNEVFAVSLS